MRDVALQRVGELPRALVIDKLYDLFKDPKWQVRWVAAQLVMKMSDTTQLPEFFAKLGQAEGMAITEPLRYGALMASMKGHRRQPGGGRRARTQAADTRCKIVLLALGYLQVQRRHGRRLGEGRLGYISDKTATPKCKADAKDCDWKCEVKTDKGSGDQRSDDAGRVRRELRQARHGEEQAREVEER